jgi:hypothetical protein
MRTLIELQEKANDALKYRISECEVKVNEHGIRVKRAVIPTERCGINDWFQKFTV